ncbi:MAG TPA: cyanophycinase [Chitinophagaceae bacterium]|nr:cyanophycinase [Chitinophagaceae bacterium]
MKYKFSLAIALAFLLRFNNAASQTTTWWPQKGTVILAGGNLSDSVATNLEKKLVSIAGGSNATIVVIPTANPKFTSQELKELKKQFESCGARQVSIINAKDKKMANTDSFANILRSATGVFITGGQPMILENIYCGTSVEKELKDLLSRGGVIGGSSAGAIIIGDMWLTWTPEFGKRTNDLGILPNVAVSPHANAARDYSVDEEVLKYLVVHPTIIGIDIDEDTILILDKQNAEVIGKGYVSIINAAVNKTKPMLRLSSGKQYNLQSK